MNQKKKMAAALTATAAYIKSGQEAQRAMAQAEQPSRSLQKIVLAGNTWAMSGRQVQMQMCNLVRMKSFHSLK